MNGSLELRITEREPFADGSSIDHLTGREDAILKRPATEPLVVHTQSATEYWQRRGSLAHTDTEGRDLAGTSALASSATVRCTSSPAATCRFRTPTPRRR